MKAGLNAVIAALDATIAPVNFFIRDDDAGWDDARLHALLRCTERVRVPIDLAVIPQAISDELAAKLNALYDLADGRIGLHQHGYAHENHEALGRKCEFGTSRDIAAQRHDLIAGRERLRALFGARLDGFFTPPWNRCSAATPDLLSALGFTGLSRDRSAETQRALPELRVDVDWCRQQRDGFERGETEGDAIAFELAHHIRSGETVGLMLHHAQMSNVELAWLEAWLLGWVRHPNARWKSMRDLLGNSRVAHSEHSLSPIEVMK
jgi:predicted deacetylase